MAQAVASSSDQAISPAARLFQARVALSQNQVPAAIDQLKSLLATNPNAATALAAETWLGEAYLAQHQPALAQAALHRVVDNPQAFPRSLVAEAELSLGLADQMLVQGDEAVAAYDQAFRLTENATTQVSPFTLIWKARAPPEACSMRSPGCRNMPAPRRKQRPRLC